MAQSNHRVFFDISIGGKMAGRIEMDLFQKEAPHLAENFRALCDGNAVDPEGNKISFKGTIIHRAVTEYMIHGGDHENGNGTGGGSIYGEKFPDVEVTPRSHKTGVLTTAHAMPKLPKKHALGTPYPFKCGSQFFICVNKAPWLDGQHAVFGKVHKGMNVVWAINNVGSRSGTMSQVVKIVDCGQIRTMYVGTWIYVVFGSSVQALLAAGPVHLIN
ncbi:unnamed protein product [Urochloa decumbens]|uniref:Peptidyl-prolyl cis-trans isomerase n=1 Tax=Urochloa decumbens TaxID=240449 RepID=A0ABC9BEM2_9POAL